MDTITEPTWKKILKIHLASKEFAALASFVNKEYAEQTVYPKQADIFQAFNLCPFHKIKVVILGQDPYHGENQAMGLAFSVPNGVTVPPSLRNIYKEIISDSNSQSLALGKSNGDLTHWASQGVLLLNSVLTVRAGAPTSHKGYGWEEFTTGVIQQISRNREGVVFLLWGNYAQNKGDIIDPTKHLVLEASHPSPFSAHAGFLGCKHFSKTNTYLEQQGKKPITWQPT